MAPAIIEVPPVQCEEVDEKMEKDGETACLLSQRAALLRKMGRYVRT